MFLEILILVALTLFNGALAMSELAVVSAREARLRRMAEDGRPGAQAALTLKEDPGRFLSSCLLPPPTRLPLSGYYTHLCVYFISASPLSVISPS